MILVVSFFILSAYTMTFEESAPLILTRVAIDGQYLRPSFDSGSARLNLLFLENCSPPISHSTNGVLPSHRLTTKSRKMEDLQRAEVCREEYRKLEATLATVASKETAGLADKSIDPSEAIKLFSASGFLGRPVSWFSRNETKSPVPHSIVTKQSLQDALDAITSHARSLINKPAGDHLYLNQLVRHLQETRLNLTLVIEQWKKGKINERLFQMAAITWPDDMPVELMSPKTIKKLSIQTGLYDYYGPDSAENSKLLRILVEVKAKMVIQFNFSVRKLNQSLAIRRVVAFDMYDQNASHVCTSKYAGPKMFLIADDCTKSASLQDDTLIINGECIKSPLNKKLWKRSCHVKDANNSQLRIQIQTTNSHRYIYCVGHEIASSGDPKSSCPDHPIKLPLWQPFVLDDNVSVDTSNFAGTTMNDESTQPAIVERFLKYLLPSGRFSVDWTEPDTLEASSNDPCLHSAEDPLQSKIISVLLYFLLFIVVAWLIKKMVMLLCKFYSKTPESTKLRNDISLQYSRQGGIECDSGSSSGLTEHVRSLCAHDRIINGPRASSKF